MGEENVRGVALDSVASRCVLPVSCSVMVVHQPPEEFTESTAESLAAAAPAG